MTRSLIKTKAKGCKNIANLKQLSNIETEMTFQKDTTIKQPTVSFEHVLIKRNVDVSSNGSINPIVKITNKTKD